MNPESDEGYHRFCELAFGNRKANLLSMSDGAMCYRCRCDRCKLWFEEHFAVHHSRKPKGEFSRPLPEVLADVITQEKRPGMAGTMTLDKEWGLLKAPLPRNTAARTEADRARCDMLVRAQQFRRMHSTTDKWQAFLGAARRWRESQTELRPTRPVKLGRFALRDQAQRRSKQTLGREQTLDCEVQIL